MGITCGPPSSPSKPSSSPSSQYDGVTSDDLDEFQQECARQEANRERNSNLRSGGGTSTGGSNTNNSNTTTADVEEANYNANRQLLSESGITGNDLNKHQLDGLKYGTFDAKDIKNQEIAEHNLEEKTGIKDMDHLTKEDKEMLKKE